MPATLKLQHFGRVIHEFFGHYPYQVGSSLRVTLGTATTWRDVDVRLILPDEEFDALFGELTRPRCINLKWNAACLAFAALGRDMTDLPIDFQVDRQTEANENYGDQPRSAIGILLAEGVAYSPHDVGGSKIASAAPYSCAVSHENENPEIGWDFLSAHPIRARARRTYLFVPFLYRG